MRFTESDIDQDIFDEVVLLGLRHKFIEGKTLHADSTPGSLDHTLPPGSALALPKAIPQS